jgi:hypothetical protein
MMAEEEKSNSQKDMEMPWKSPYETLWVGTVSVFVSCCQAGSIERKGGWILIVLWSGLVSMSHHGDIGVSLLSTGCFAALVSTSYKLSQLHWTKSVIKKNVSVSMDIHRNRILNDV